MADPREVRLVRWIDSSLQNTQVHVSDAPVPELITSVGFVVKETDDYVVLARDDHKEDEWRGLCAIPKCCIRPDAETSNDFWCSLGYWHSSRFVCSEQTPDSL